MLVRTSARVVSQGGHTRSSGRPYPKYAQGGHTRSTRLAQRVPGMAQIQSQDPPGLYPGEAIPILLQPMQPILAPAELHGQAHGGVVPVVINPGAPPQVQAIPITLLPDGKVVAAATGNQVFGSHSFCVSLALQVCPFPAKCDPRFLKFQLHSELSESG